MFQLLFLTKICVIGIKQGEIWVLKKIYSYTSSFGLMLVFLQMCKTRILANHICNFIKCWLLIGVEKIQKVSIKK